MTEYIFARIAILLEFKMFKQKQNITLQHIMKAKRCTIPKKHFIREINE